MLPYYRPSNDDEEWIPRYNHRCKSPHESFTNSYIRWPTGRTTSYPKAIGIWIYTSKYLPSIWSLTCSPSSEYTYASQRSPNIAYRQAFWPRGLDFACPSETTCLASVHRPRLALFTGYWRPSCIHWNRRSRNVGMFCSGKGINAFACNRDSSVWHDCYYCRVAPILVFPCTRLNYPRIGHL